MELDKKVEKFHNDDEDYSSHRSGGFFIRLLSALLDGFILGIVQKSSTTLVLFLASLSGLPFNNFQKLPPSWQFSVIILNFVGSYFIILRPIKKYGQTPGKRILKLKILNDDFVVNFSWWQIIFREFFAKIITLSLFFVSGPMIIFRTDKRVLHDFICGTRVVRLKEND